MLARAHDVSGHQYIHRRACAINSLLHLPSLSFVVHAGAYMQLHAALEVLKCLRNLFHTDLERSVYSDVLPRPLLGPLTHMRATMSVCFTFF